MNLDQKDVAEFKVINDEKWMKGTKSTMLLSEFLKFSPEYEWINDLDIEVKGPNGNGETQSKKFKGLEEIK